MSPRLRFRSRPIVLGLLCLTSNQAWGQATPPSVPQNVTVTLGQAKLTLSWQAPSSWGSYSADEYQIEWKRAGTSPSTDLQSLFEYSSYYQNQEGNKSIGILLDHDSTEYKFSGIYYGSDGNNEHTVWPGISYDLRIRAVAKESGTTNLQTSNWVTVTNKVPGRVELTWPSLTHSISEADSGCSLSVLYLTERTESYSPEIIDSILQSAQLEYSYHTDTDGEHKCDYTPTLNDKAGLSDCNASETPLQDSIPDAICYGLIDAGDDNLNEEREAYSISILSPMGDAVYTVGSPTAITINIEDRDKPEAPILTLRSRPEYVEARWTRPAGPVTKYQLRYKQTTSSTWTEGSELPASPTSSNITGLTNNIDYQVQVRANDGQEDELNGWSAWSALQSTEQPEPPRDIMACAGDSRITLEWLPPTDAGWKGYRRVGFQVRYGNRTDSYYTEDVPSAYANTRKVTIKAGMTDGGLKYATNGQSETWQVRTVGEVYRTGTGSGFDITGRDKIYSAWANAPTVTIGQANQPTNLTVTPGLHKLDVSWEAPGCNVPITDYEINYTSNSTVAADATVASNTSDSLSAGWVAARRTDTGTRETLDDDSRYVEGVPVDLATIRYRVRVRAVTENGPGPWSDVKSGAPKTTVSFGSSDVIEINEGSDDFISVELTAGRANAFEGTLAFNVESSSEPTASKKDDFKPFSETYDFGTASDPTREATTSDIATRDDGINEDDEVLIISLVETPQLIPTGITTKTIRIKDSDPIADPVINFRNAGGEQQFTSSWTKPEGPVTEYQLIWRIQDFETCDSDESRKCPVVSDPNDSNAGWTTVEVPATSTNAGEVEHTVENLEHGTRYEMYVRATDGLVDENSATVWSPWSDQGATTTARDPDSPPPAVTPQDPNSSTVYPPQNIKAVSNSSGALTVSWRGTDSRQEEPCIYRYRVILTHEDAVQNVYGPPTDEAWTCAHEYEFTDLTPGRYDVSVVASVVNNVGDPSDPISVIVAGGPVLSMDRSAAYDSATETWTFRESQEEELTLNLSQALTVASTVTIEAIPGSCTKIACEQLYKNLPATIALPSGQTSVTINMTADYLGNDNITNADKVRGSFKFRLVRTPNAPYALRDTEVESLILEDGNKLTLSFGTPNNQIIAEGSTADIKIIADREADFPITVQLRTRADRTCADLVVVDHYDADACSGFMAGDTALHPSTTADATKNTDYIDPGNLMVVLPANKREVSTSIQIKADLEVEDDNEFFIVYLNDPDDEGFIEVGPDVAVVQIVDVALVSFVKTEAANWSAADNRFEYTEGLSQDKTTTNGVDTFSEHGKLKLALSRALDHDARVRIEVVPDSCNASPCTLYKGLPITVTFSEGDTEAEVDFAYNHLRADNQISEALGIFQIRLAYPESLRGDYSIKDTAPETVAFADDDVVTLSFSPVSYSVSEGIPAHLGINADKITTYDIPVTISTRPDQFCSDINDDIYSNGSIDPDTCAPPENPMVSLEGPKPDLGHPDNTPDATLDVDYRVPNPTTILRAGSLNTSIVIATLRDAVADEPEEVLIVTMDFPDDVSGRVEIGPDNGLVVIRDSTTVLNLSASKTTVAEGESITITVRPAGGHGGILNLSLSTEQGTSESGDFSITPISTELPPGTDPATFTITAIADTDTDDETFTVGLANLPQGYAAGPSIGITITDPGTQPQIKEEEPKQEENTEPTNTSPQEDSPPVKDPEDDPPEPTTPPLTLPQAICDSLERQVGRAFSCDLPSASGGSSDYTYTTSTLPDGLTLIGVNGRQSIAGTPTESGSWTVSYTVTDSQGESQTRRFGIVIKAPPPLEVSILENYSSPNAGSPEGEPVTFTLQLSRPADFEVSIDYTTARGSRGTIGGTNPADPGSDFVQVSGTTTFEPGTTSVPIAVPTIKDSVDEGREYFEFSISNPAPSDKVVVNRFSQRPHVGYIKNDGALQSAWLSRLGRTVSSQIHDSVSNRLSDDRDATRPTPSNSLIVGGRNVSNFQIVRTFDTASTPAAVALRQPASAIDLELNPWNSNPNRPSEASTSIRDLTPREVLQGSSFNYTTALRPDSAAAPALTLSTWGEVVSNSFAGAESTRNGSLSLSGDVTTGILGVDVDLGRTLAGVALSHTESLGAWTSPVDAGELATTLTTVSPYARFTLSPTLTLWGIAGLGRGDMHINADTAAPAELAHTAVGARATLPSLAGIDWSLEADALLTRLDTADAPGSAATHTATGRTRLILEGSKSIALAAHTLRPAFELGVRHDAGDAETGAGLEFGAGLDYTHPGGLTLAARTRQLLTHADAAFTEFGASFSAAYHAQTDGQGLTVSFDTTLGNASSGTARLWHARTATDFIRNTAGYLPPAGYNAAVGYGLPLARSTLLATPTLGFNRGYDGSANWRFGTTLRPASVRRAGFEVSLDTTLSNHNGQPEYGLMLQGRARW